jgi:tol-pal system protein YbgF
MAQPAPSRLRRLAPLLTLIAVFAIAGCEIPQENQDNNEAELRGIVASDRQQINALQDQVNRLNDHIAEMEHNNDSGGGSDADKARLAELEREVQALKSGGANGAASPNGTPPPPGGDVTGAAPGAGPDVPGVNPPPGAPGDVTNAAPPPGNFASTPPPTNNADDNSDTDNSPQIASSAPPPNAVPPPAPTPPGPPLIGGSPSWRAVLNQELLASQTSNDSAAKVYRAGLVAMKAGKFPNAIAIFQGLQRKYPKSPLSEPAEYFSANALYELGKYDQSILQFNDLVMRFPRGRFASASLLSEAQAFMKMNDRVDARLTLQKLISDHPDAPEAASARSMMNSLANS